MAPEVLCRTLRRRDGAALLLDGRGGFEEAWGPLVAVDPRPIDAHPAGDPAGSDAALDRLDRLLTGRRARGGPEGLGLAVLLAYELLDREAGPSRLGDPLPEMLVLAVDASFRFLRDGRALLAVRGEDTESNAAAARRVDAILRKLERTGDPLAPQRAAPAPGALATSLPREPYLAAVARIQDHIRLGDIYQANLAQRFSAPLRADPFDVYRALTDATPAPRSAFLETEEFALASVSPEVFLRAHPAGTIETWPIKGTRPRGATPAEDLAAARALLASEKDHAELTMIVDLERNDLGRVCRTGSIRVDALASLRSFAAVHHLVARVAGDLRPGTRPSDLIRATFPGGSVTGAPKIRAMEVLRESEPVRRGFYTGSLLWFGDDGSMDSSILIRSVVMAGGRALVGAGGGIVADSDAEAEWRESNDKARALLHVLGFAPEEAA